MLRHRNDASVRVEDFPTTTHPSVDTTRCPLHASSQTPWQKTTRLLPPRLLAVPSSWRLSRACSPRSYAGAAPCRPSSAFSGSRKSTRPSPLAHNLVSPPAWGLGRVKGPYWSAYVAENHPSQDPRSFSVPARILLSL
ncbi:hypothetical protein BV20DRAFT_961161 [Pilatotrama ljubarskyi]|nr:hypothetical protein BV20DRAFT_961161 [Pilatotrama ljubarskyi]